MMLGFRFFYDVYDGSLFINQKRHAVNSIIGTTHKFLFTPYPKKMDNLLLFISNKWKWQMLSFNKSLMRFLRISTDANDRDPFLTELLVIVAYGTGLINTSRCIVFRIKIDSVFRALKSMMANDLADFISTLTNRSRLDYF